MISIIAKVLLAGAILQTHAGESYQVGPFLVHPDRTFTDRRTNLMWSLDICEGTWRQVNNERHYWNCLQELKNKTYNDWRFPTEKELRSLIKSCELYKPNHTFQMVLMELGMKSYVSGPIWIMTKHNSCYSSVFYKEYMEAIEMKDAYNSKIVKILPGKYATLIPVRDDFKRPDNYLSKVTSPANKYEEDRWWKVYYQNIHNIFQFEYLKYLGFIGRAINLTVAPTWNGEFRAYSLKEAKDSIERFKKDAKIVKRKCPQPTAYDHWDFYLEMDRKLNEHHKTIWGGNPLGAGHFGRGGIVESGMYDSFIIRCENGYLVSKPIGHIFAYPEEYDLPLRPWTKPVDYEKKTIPYLGMIDDDLFYDFRLKNPFSKVRIQNPHSPFLYVYKFDVLRKRVGEWAYHDYLLHGYIHGYNCEYETYGLPVKMSQVKARITYGPVTRDPNHPYLRYLRVLAFLRLYHAKLRIANLLHPAPEWKEEIGDYVQDYDYRKKNIYPNVRNIRSIDPHSCAYENITDEEYAKRVIESLNEDYWKVMDGPFYRPIDAIESFEFGDTKAPRISARIVRFEAILRDLYLYKAFVRSPKQVIHDLDYYVTDQWLSIALWSGQTGHGKYRHQFTGGMKHAYPFFDREDKVGHTHTPDQYKDNPTYSRSYFPKRFRSQGGVLLADGLPVKHTAGPSNTTGIIYAGHMTADELAAFCEKTGKTYKQVWEDALKGPVMIISDRTLRRYGKEYFEKLVGHPLKVVDVTGAVVESMGRVVLIPFDECIDNLVNMDYFYYKPNADTIVGEKLPRGVPPKSEIPKTPVNPWKLARYPVSPTMNEIFGSFHNGAPFFPNINDFADIGAEVRAAMEKDEKLFPGLSLWMANAIPFHKDEMIISPSKWAMYRYLMKHGEDVLNLKTGRWITLGLTRRDWDTWINPKKDPIPPFARAWGIDPEDERRGFPFYSYEALVYCGRNAIGRVPSLMTWAKENKDTIVDKYMTYSYTPRSIEILECAIEWRRRGDIEKLKSKPGSFITNLQKFLAKEIPWMTYNPHTFMVYYNNIDRLKKVFDIYGHNIAVEVVRSHSGVIDGNVVWAIFDDVFPAQGPTFWRYGPENTRRGWIRKSYAKDGVFSQWEHCPFMVYSCEFSPSKYELYYVHQKTSNGSTMLVRELDSLDGTVDVCVYADVRLLDLLFPGMFRFTNMLPLNYRYYFAENNSRYAYSLSQFTPDLRSPIERRRYLYRFYDFKTVNEMLSRHKRLPLNIVKRFTVFNPTDHYSFVVKDTIDW